MKALWRNGFSKIEPNAEQLGRNPEDPYATRVFTKPPLLTAVFRFMQKIMAGKKSAPAIRYRLDRLAMILGDKKMRDVTRQDVITTLDTIAEGQRKGQTAKQLTGKVLTQAKRLRRFEKSREWVAASCVEELTRRDFDAKPTKRGVTLRFDELAAIWRTLENPANASPIR